MKSTPYTADKINDEVWCRLGISKIAGIGVIAIRDIPPNQIIYKSNELQGYQYQRKNLHLTDRDNRILFSHSEWLKIHPAIKKILLDRNCYLKDYGEEGYSVEHPNNHQEFVVFMNHSKTPNSNGYCTNQTIKEGEELTEEYWSFGPEAREHYHKEITGL